MDEDAAAAATTTADMTADEPNTAGTAQPARPANLEGVLDELAEIAANDADGEVSVAEVMATLGERSFGPLLLVPSLIGLSPIGAIPMVPAVMVAIEILIIAQMLLGFEHFWIPKWLASRAIAAPKLARAMAALRGPARFVDGFLAPRLSFLTEGVFFYMIAVMCLLVALVTPIIELVPIAGIVPNAAVAAFALAITARDGLWVLIAFATTGLTGWLIAAPW